ncbi:MAG: ATP-dependent DNA helicase [Candidatus Methanomethylophilaceae archaeon]|nr:ATP-dependent DNA helicase [Candidatus Methanomethylophilaceae archaeon]
MDLFPYEFRPKQAELVRFIDSAVREGRPAVIEAGTGIGKTVSSLCGTLPFVLEKGTKLLYLTRTKSQQKQVVREVAAIGHGILCVPMQGRSAYSCPMMREDPEAATGTPEELSRLCSEYKRRDEGGRCRCPYFDSLGDADIGYWAKAVRGMDPEGFSDMCESAGVCPYELRKLLLPMADVIAVPYPFVFVPGACLSFASWTGIPLEETVMVVDEAHNLPDYLRESQTYGITRASLDKAEHEAIVNGDPYLEGETRVTHVVSAVGKALSHALKEHLVDEDGILPPYFLEEELMEGLGMSSVSLGRTYRSMLEVGEAIADRKGRSRRLPRSYIRSLAVFLAAWSEEDDAFRVKLVVGGDNPGLQSYCMDPSEAAGPLNRCVSSVHMSGTLEPLGSYVDEMGLFDPRRLVLGSVFPPENLLSVYSDEVSMRYEERFQEENYRRTTDLLVSVLGSVDVNAAVFFQSYGVMDRMLEDGLAERIGRTAFYERRGMPQKELMDSIERFRTSEGCVLFCVLGGRISEGIDFPDKALELAVIVGVPFPKPTARLRALRRYYDMRFGDGRGFVSIIPASRKMRQAIGRLIRSETDRGAAVVLDRRVATLRDVPAVRSDDIVGDVKRFLSERRGRHQLTL